ncbi:PilN domain-containing protein [Sporohalobacter salinus]|uniref:PilN domain-containing protein n=1 Tax=Sporohalobacter salinus TaxID=1494606 RepID=UPI00195F6C94|nr:PilN domain-containing protein [Sporohalobacter salinus]MBM7622739.1 Tfp pilus assembly protein PilN [Sporohalobacter salinus]
MVNLLPPEYIEKTKINIDKFLIGALVVSLLLIPLSYYIQLRVKINRVENKIGVVNTELNKISKESNRLNKLKQDYKSLKNSLQKRKKIVGDKLNWIIILKELRRITPNKAWIKDFKVAKHKLFELKGHALNNKQLGLMVDKLSSSSYFRDITVDFSRQKKIKKDGYKKQTTIYYQISGKLKRNVGDNNEVE